jgi:uncharacterized protein (DUF488 family)
MACNETLTGAEQHSIKLENDLPMTTLYTIGYEGTDIDRFVATLKAVGIHLLADVRALPLSRKKGFSKTGLRVRIEREGMEYIHLGALGDPKEGRDAARAGRFDQFRKIYNKHLAQAEPQEKLRELGALVKQRPTCLMCFERDPTECHRLIVASQLPKSVRTFHLYGDEPSRYVRNAAKLPGSRADQGVAAA